MPQAGTLVLPADLKPIWSLNGISRYSDVVQKCQEADKDLSVCIVEKGAEVGVLTSLVLLFNVMRDLRMCLFHAALLAS